MKYAAVLELSGTAIPARFTHGNISMDGTVLFLQLGDGFKFICGSCGFIMRGGSPLTCGRCGKQDILVDIDRGTPPTPPQGGGK